MRKSFLICLFVACLMLSGFEMHKFYVSIYRVDYVPSKERLEVTSRIFVDDLNAALLKKFHTRTNIGDKSESPQDVALMNKYLAENFKVTLNDKPVSLTYISNEIETNVIIGYYKISNIPNLSKIEITNTSLMELFPDQQNIIQMNSPGKKQSLLLTAGSPSGILKW